MSAIRDEFKNYDRRLISICEVVGAHYVDVYFNHVWSFAVANAKLAKKESLTDVYVHTVQTYIASVKTSEKSYQETVGKLFEYYKTATRHRNSSFVDFQEAILVQFIPPEWYERCRTKQKDEAFCNIVNDLISNIGVYMTSPDMLRRVIDSHEEQPRVTIQMAQVKAITILITKRDEIHNRFLGRLGQARDIGSSEMVEKLKDAIRKLVKDKGKLKARVEELEEELEEALDAASDLKKRHQANKKKETQLRKLAELLVRERQTGTRRAAFTSAIPPANDEGELSDDPFPTKLPPRNTVGEPRNPLPSKRSGRVKLPPRSRIAEDFFSKPMDLTSGGPEKRGILASTTRKEPSQDGKKVVSRRRSTPVLESGSDEESDEVESDEVESD
jgi:hypothetical protein